ncbi:hypothetical protein VTO73DRAFT_8670 [Trametes versicolor]
MHLNKWVMNPAKLSKFSLGTMIPAAADQYLRCLVDTEMPYGLKRYMEVELFPHIYCRPRKGISLHTTRRWLRHEGFRYLAHKKSLYYDRYDHPDVVNYRQKVFLPQMEKHRRCIVEFVIGDVGREVEKAPQNFVERQLVLVAHNEMTVQANNGKAKSWVPDGKYPLQKKGVERGIHCSDVICLTIGLLEEAGQSMGYGKNYEGYWTGELFVKQIQEKIIPAFEAAHGPGYQALIMVDNSQGHSAYSADTLLTSREASRLECGMDITQFEYLIYHIPFHLVCYLPYLSFATFNPTTCQPPNLRTSKPPHFQTSEIKDKRNKSQGVANSFAKVLPLSHRSLNLRTSGRPKPPDFEPMYLRNLYYRIFGFSNLRIFGPSDFCSARS